MELFFCFHPTFNYQNIFCSLPIISMQGSILRTYKNHGFGSQWYCYECFIPRDFL